jgi:CheY-like chemotaxis protein
MDVPENSDVLDILLELLKDNEDKIDAISKKISVVEKITKENLNKKISDSFSSSDPKSTRTILVVDDDKNLALSVRLILEGEGYNVDTANTALSALRKLSKKSYDLVFIDWNLPDMLGNEVAEKIEKEHSDTVVILISGYTSLPSNVERGHEILTKPIDPEALLQITQRVLSK